MLRKIIVAMLMASMCSSSTSSVSVSVVTSGRSAVISARARWDGIEHGVAVAAWTVKSKDVEPKAKFTRYFTSLSSHFTRYI